MAPGADYPIPTAADLISIRPINADRGAQILIRFQFNDDDDDDGNGYCTTKKKEEEEGGGGGGGGGKGSGADGGNINHVDNRVFIMRLIL